MTRALPVYGKSAFSRSDQPSARFSTVDIARAVARASPERTAEIRAEELASKLVQCKAQGEERHPAWRRCENRTRRCGLRSAAGEFHPGRLVLPLLHKR